MSAHTHTESRHNTCLGLKCVCANLGGLNEVTVIQSGHVELPRQGVHRYLQSNNQGFTTSKQVYTSHCQSQSY